MLRPVIMIGCGGSGQKAVRYIRDSVRRQLDHAGWDEGMPRSWQFLGIDTLNVQESPGEIPTIPASDYQSVALNFNTFENLTDALMAKHGPSTEGYKELLGWRPKSTDVNVPLLSGAGQMRAVGRTAGVMAYDTVLRDKIRRAFTACGEGAPELARVSNKLGVSTPVGAATPEPIVAVLGSMAGGTGAGIMLDVIDLVRRTSSSGQYPIAILFTADIFGSDISDGMSANGMAFMSELMSAYWDAESSGTTLIPAAIGVNRRGPHCSFVVGRRNLDGRDLRSSKNVYRAVGEAMSAWIISDKVQTKLFNFVSVNWQGYAQENQGGYPFAKEHFPGVLSSFGSATLSIGRARFKEYSSKLLQRDSIEYLDEGYFRRRHLEFGQAGATLNRAAMVRRYVDENIQEFKAACGWVDGESGTNLTEDFFVTSKQRDYYSRARQRVADQLNSRPQSTGNEWRSLLNQQAESAKGDLGGHSKGEYRSLLDEWGARSLERVLRVSSAYAGKYGLEVAAGLVGRAASDLAVLASEMLRDSSQQGELVQTSKEAFASALSTVGNDRTQFSHPKVQSGLDQLATSLTHDWKRTRLEETARVVEAFGSQVLQPLQMRLEMALGEINETIRPSNGDASILETWPDAIDGGVPEGFLPSPVEFFLEDPSTWPSKLLDLSQETFDLLDETTVSKEYGVKFQPVNAVDAVRYHIAVGDFMAKNEHGESARIAPLVWVDGDGSSDRIRWSPGQQTRFTISVDPEQIAERVEAWINRPSSALQLSINESLNEYLRENDSGGLPIRDHNERLARFRQRLSEALAQSKPLVQIDNSVYATAHNARALETVPLVQGFPFATGHPAYEIVRETFDESIPNSDLFAAGTDGESVLISSFIQYPVHPIVVSSICEPLRSAVNQYRNDPSGLTSAFWQFRRTKTLEDYVPLADPVRRAMIRGFVIARLLGYLSIDPSEQARISTPGLGVKSFPYPLLTHVSQDNMLPALLEAFPLTFADAPVMQQAAFSAYNQLYELGKQSGEKYLIHSDVVTFIETGNIVGEIVDQLAAENRKLHTLSDPNPDQETQRREKEQRRSNLLEYVDANLRHFRFLKEERFSGLEHRTRTGYVEPEDTLTLELINDLIPEYERIREAIEKAGSAGSRA